jgi:hypothetical protein
MARVAGIKFEKDTKGTNRFVRIDLKKYGKEINPFLENVGAVEPDEFDQVVANALTLEETRQNIHTHIMSHDWSKIGRKK